MGVFLVTSRQTGCWMRPATTIIIVIMQTWLTLSQSFDPWAQKETVCEKLFTLWDSSVAIRQQVGEGCTLWSSHILTWNTHFAVESTKDHPQWGWHREQTNSNIQQRGEGQCCCNFTSEFPAQPKPWSAKENWAHPISTPHFLNVYSSICIFGVNQIYTTDLLSFPMRSLTFIFFSLENKSHMTRWGMVPLFYQSVWQNYYEDKFCLGCICFFLTMYQLYGILHLYLNIKLHVQINDNKQNGEKHNYCIPLSKKFDSFF